MRVCAWVAWLVTAESVFLAQQEPDETKTHQRFEFILSKTDGPPPIAPVFPFAFGVGVGIALMRIAALSCREKAEVIRLSEAAVEAAERAEASAAAAAAAAGYAEVAGSAAEVSADTASRAAANAAAAGQNAEDAADSASLAAARFPSSASISALSQCPSSPLPVLPQA
jgi:hypothetical protein